MKIILSSRRHHYLAIASTFLITLALIAATVSCSCGDGNGNGNGDGDGNGDDDVVEIQNWYDLDLVRNNLVGSYVLMEDLDDTTDGYDELVGDTGDNRGWQPIGTEGNAFKGTFDGNRHTISKLFIDRPDEDEVGLFGRIQEGVVRNVGLLSVDVTGKRFVGALVGYSWKGTIDSDIRPPDSMTYSHGSVTGEENVGGLVGNNYDGTVNQCESSAEVFVASSAPDEDRWRTGGLVGLNSGNVLHCDYNGVVNGDRQVGGLVGMNERLVTIVGHVEDCGGEYSVNGNLEVGGVAGRNMGDIRRASFKGDVNGIMIGDGLVALNEGATANAYSSDTALQGSYVGGVVGVNEGTLEDCSAEATVEGYQYVGGLAGANEGTVAECSADSKVTGDSNVGGLVGENQGTLDNCSSCGEVTGDSNTGCLVGHNTGTVNNSDSTSWVTGTSDGGDLVGLNEGVISGTRYNLRMAVAPAGTGTATDMSGGSPYAAGVSVSIKAVPAAGYHFINWTSPAGSFGNANAAETTFTMPAQDVTVTANFEVGVPYTLTMAASPILCGTATDLTGASPYPEGTVVSIQAAAAAGYQFVGWTAAAGSFSNANTEVTSFTMPGQDVIVTANFVMAYTDFACYWVDQETVPYIVPYIGETVYLEDQFSALEAELGWPWYFCNPTDTWYDELLTPISSPDHHLAAYSLAYEEEPQEWFVEVNNQFGTQQLTVWGPVALAVPTQKVEPWYHKPPVGLDHYLLYEVIEGPSVDGVVGLKDEFGYEEVLVTVPVYFANPVRKTHGDEVTEIVNPEAHGVIYYIEGDYVEMEVQVVNQFGEQTFHVYGPVALALPSEKVYYEPIS